MPEDAGRPFLVRTTCQHERGYPPLEDVQTIMLPHSRFLPQIGALDARRTLWCHFEAYDLTSLCMAYSSFSFESSDGTRKTVEHWHGAP
jgi:hypothetical protein